MNNYAETLERINAAAITASSGGACDLSDASLRRRLFCIGEGIPTEPVSYRLLLSAYKAASAGRFFQSDSQQQIPNGYKFLWVSLPEDRHQLNFTHYIFSSALRSRGWEQMPGQLRSASLAALSPDDRDIYFRDFLQARHDMALLLLERYSGPTSAITFWFHR